MVPHAVITLSILSSHLICDLHSSGESEWAWLNTDGPGTHEASFKVLTSDVLTSAVCDHGVGDPQRLFLLYTVLPAQHRYPYQPRLARS